jgi:hypothetical protein
MKKNLLFILLSFLSCAANSQNCFWARNGGGTGNEEGENLTTDSNGNVYVVGNNQNPTVTFGSITLTGGYYFIVKYNAGGTEQWAKVLEGYAYGVVTDNADNIYITGSYGGTKSFGSTTLTSAGESDVFIAKLDPSGNFIWAKSAGGANGDYANKIATDGNGNLFITGSFYSPSLVLDSYTLTHHTGSPGPDFFVAKYDDSGNLAWAKGTGGNRDDIGYGVAADASGNSYVTGEFASDSIKFGTITLYTTAAGAHNMFLTKYDPSGNVVWSKATCAIWGNTNPYDIKINASNQLYVAGEFTGVSVKFGSDSLLNQSSGSSDAFIAKFDSNGNALWARSAGGTNYDYCRGVAIDNLGNVNLIGAFSGTNIIFGSDTTINNSAASSMDIFVARYNSSGSFIHAIRGGGVGLQFGRGIAAGQGDNVYFTGFFHSSVSFGGSSLSASVYSDMFVADMFTFNSGISSSTNSTCFGANDGTITTTASGGNLPYTYSWSTSPVQTTANVSGLAPGTYVVTITEGYGCAQISSAVITEPAASVAEICMVTVDSLSQNNIIVWDKTSFTDVDSFTVYREITTNNYQPIATIAYDSLSQFIDTVRARYFPNTGDPNAGTYRYKIAATNTCGNAGPLSPYHNTIYLLNSSGTFYWTQLYTIEGGANPVSSYVLMRDNLSNGTWTTVASVSGTQQTVADPLYAVYQATATWRVETQWSISCTPTRAITTSVSNKFSNLATTVNENKLENSFNVYPNPSEGIFTVQYSADPKNSIRSFEVYNLIGEKVYESRSGSVQGTVMDLSMQPKGVYYLSVKTAAESFTKKLIIQ